MMKIFLAFGVLAAANAALFAYFGPKVGMPTSVQFFGTYVCAALGTPWYVKGPSVMDIPEGSWADRQMHKAMRGLFKLVKFVERS